jgi:hypothetical protein
MACNRLKIFDSPRGQIIDSDNLVSARDKQFGQMASYEACPTGYQSFHNDLREKIR